MMKEILITSSALILALLVIRRIFRGVLSRRFQYALWALVLVRLLVPVNLLPAADFSVLTAAQPIQAVVDQQIAYVPPVYLRPVEHMPIDQAPFAPTPDEPVAVIKWDPVRNVADGYYVQDPGGETVTVYETQLFYWDILELVWKGGMILIGAFFVLSNLWFYRKLRKNRTPFATLFEKGTRKVYLVPDGILPSPCLFGRSIYITPAVAEDDAKLRHVIAHETTHAKHLDPLWSLLRCVCLTVYWFDPLVWIAAACSKTDCELACDESVLNTLGEAERIPYGQTLVSLIPVKRASNPMIAATTMTSGKKQLKDRVTRIAQKPRQFAAAALAVALLATIVSACTFTGALHETVDTVPIESQEPQELRALTGEELRWFNEEFFNSSATNQSELYATIAPGDDIYYNIRNQFASPFILYGNPYEIDLYELLYCEGTPPSRGEIREILNWDPDDLPCPAYKLTTGEINDILIEHTGLPLEELGKDSLTYTYDENTDAWYWMHGDTNYCGELTFTVGTREGSIVKLYHTGGSRWYCVTLEEQADGVYWFRSNLECEAPAIPTALPAWEPAATVSLKELEPYVAPAVTVEEHRDDQAQRMAGYQVGEQIVRFYRSTDGRIYAAVELEATETRWRGNCFLTLPGDQQDYDVSFFFDLLGHDGIAITYRPGYMSRLYETVTDYYYFDQSGVPILLAQCHGDARAMDLDGDGQNELVAPRQIFFQREGVTYEAQLSELLPSACPELSYWSYEYWDIYGKYLTIWGDFEDSREWTRYLYFDGENILIYKNDKPTTDHMVDGADKGVPAIVVEKAKELTLTTVEKQADGTFRDANWREYPDELKAFYDDWRVESFHGPYTYDIAGVTIVAWGFNHERHTTTPEKVVLAGGKYMDEDGWVSPGYPGTDYVFCVQNEQGELTFGWYDWFQESMNSYFVYNSILQAMQEQGVILADGSTYAGLQFKSDLDYLLDHSDRVRIQYDDGQGSVSAYWTEPANFNGSYYRIQLTDPENYVWGYLGQGDDWFAPDGPSVILSQENWYLVIQFWYYDDIVMVKYSNQKPVWYMARSTFDPMDVFYYRSTSYYQARSWYDQVEWNLTGNVIIPDQGQSPLEIAQEWTEAHEETLAHLTPGGSMTCTYVKVVDVEVIPMPENWFYDDLLQYPHFAFSFSTIFVPENPDAVTSLMAGNTGEYEGSDPDVPQGAFQYWRMAAMYLKDGYWRCGMLGTG